MSDIDTGGHEGDVSVGLAPGQTPHRFLQAIESCRWPKARAGVALWKVFVP
jgi:hypothetical protein